MPYFRLASDLASKKDWRGKNVLIHGLHLKSLCFLSSIVLRCCHQGFFSASSFHAAWPPWLGFFPDGAQRPCIRIPPNGISKSSYVIYFLFVDLSSSGCGALNPGVNGTACGLGVVVPGLGVMLPVSAGVANPMAICRDTSSTFLFLRHRLGLRPSCFLQHVSSKLPCQCRPMVGLWRNGCPHC